MTRRFRILLVDDDDNDRLLFRSALQESGLDVELFEATDGFAAINYLLGFSEYGDRAKFPYPDLVFLDLKMPGMDGFAVLKEIRTNLGLKKLPIVISTNSNLRADAIAAYSLGTNAFHQKPGRYQDLIGLLQSVITPWLISRTTESDRKSKET